MELAEVSAHAGVLSTLVVFPPTAPLRTSEVPDLPSAALRALPGLRGHRCDNGAGRTFADELADTELAHLVEHAALELMAMAGSSPSLRGATSWDVAADGRGVFRLRLEFEDEAVARGALEAACALVGALTRGEPVPDALATALRLRGLQAR